MFIHRVELSPEPLPNTTFTGVSLWRKSLLRGTTVAMYIVGQERRLVDPPSQVVAGVRTVTTQMDERCDAHVTAFILFSRDLISSTNSLNSLTTHFFSRRKNASFHGWRFFNLDRYPEISYCFVCSIISSGIVRVSPLRPDRREH